MKRAITYTCAAFLMVFALASTSCDSERTKYDVTVGWAMMMGVQSCETSPLSQLDGETMIIDTVHIEVFEEDDLDGEPVMFFDVDCDEHTYTIQNLEEGDYLVTLDGMGEHDGQELAFLQTSIEIEAPAEEDEYIETWGLGTGTVEVRWEFEGGFCVSNGVDTVDVQLDSTTGTTGYSEDVIDCVDELVVFEDVSWDTYSLSVQGYDMDDSQTHSGESADDFEVLPGSNITQVVTLM